jgi:antirestriction protein ArdC
VSAKIHAEITATIVAELEQGTAPWVKPWKNGLSGACMPLNAATSRPYRGVNVLSLWAATARGGYPLPRWLTFRQALALGGHVRKGEKGTPIVLVKQMRASEDRNDHSDDDDQGAVRRHGTFLRYFWVFNVAQVEGLPPDLHALPPAEPEGKRQARAEAFLTAIGADVRHGGDRACYMPSLDCILLPPFAAFEGPGHYYATRLHETGHWSGHPSRLGRDLSGRFGSRAYAAEELVAELTAAFLCAELGIEGRLRHAEYIGNWLELLRADSRAVFAAASKASEAADFLRSLLTSEVRNADESEV